jgi:hypothetical protein
MSDFEFETVTAKVPIRPYSTNTGVVTWHMSGEVISIGYEEKDNTVALRANREGLRALARDLLTLAQDEVPDGSTLYLMSKGQAPSLVEGSAALHISLHD